MLVYLGLGGFALGDHFHHVPVQQVGNGDGKLGGVQGALVQPGDIGTDVHTDQAGPAVSVEIEQEIIDQPTGDQVGKAEFAVVIGGNIAVLIQGNDGFGDQIQFGGTVADIGTAHLQFDKTEPGG